MNELTLAEAIENLYRVFARYPLKERIEGCPCCVGEERERILHARPLRELSGAQLSSFGFKAMTTFGDADDFRHFLPRLFETMTRGEFGYNEEILFGKLVYAGWTDWPAEESAAIGDFFRALVRAAVEFDREKAWLAESFITGVAIAAPDVTPYLEIWLEEISPNRIATLAYFTIEAGGEMSNAFLGKEAVNRRRILRWLTAEATVARLETLFLDEDFAKISPDLPRLLEAIYDLRK
ncbi:MAG: hypothetical protein JSS81_21790 [Acidobacteria bacterium]|nr:hypothetical protein [Acidobacteriota bacterium]